MVIYIIYRDHFIVLLGNNLNAIPILNQDMGSTQQFIFIYSFGFINSKLSAYHMSIIQVIKYLAPNLETAITCPGLLLAIELQC